MSLELPSKTEVLKWNPHQLADFLKRMDLPGSDKIVLKNMMSGSRFLTMSDNDLQRFPKVHAPLISKLYSEINKKEERRGLFSKRSTGPRYPDAGHQMLSADQQTGNHSFSSDSQAAGWAEDEFVDTDSDDCDYEDPDADGYGGGGGSAGDYESPTDDGAFAADDDDYEPPPCEPPEDLARHPCPALPPPEGDYIDNRNMRVFARGGQPILTPRPHEPAPLPSTRLPVEPSPPLSAAPPVFRENKRLLGHQFNTDERAGQPSRPHVPSRPSPSPFPSDSVGRRDSTARTPPWFAPEARTETRQEDMTPKHHTFPLPTSHLLPRPLPSGPSARKDSLPPSSSAADSLPQKLMSVMGVQRSRLSVGDLRGTLPPLPSPPHTSLGPPKGPPLGPPTEESTQDLDRRWYVGKVTRRQAESCLQQVNKDGAYVVRDSSKQADGQPFTLMVLYQDRVFNIQIRRRGNHYLLGTGLKAHETFQSVSDIISHYSQSALLLINAKIRETSSQQNHCLLTQPAGHCVTVTSWS